MISAASYPPLQKPQGRGTPRFETGKKKQEESPGHPPENYAATGSLTGALNFTGQSQDTSVGLFDFLYRKNSPVQGRWISPDPSGLAAVSMENPQSWNRYAYVGNSPLNAMDPLGLHEINDCFGCMDDNFGNPNATTYYLNGMQVSPLAFNSSILGQGGSGLEFAFAPGSGVGAASGTLGEMGSWAYAIPLYQEGCDNWGCGGITLKSPGGWKFTPADNGSNILTAGVVFFKMKNRPVDSGPLNKKFLQPSERNPMNELLEELKEKADKVNDLFDVTMEAIKALSLGGSVSVPVMIGPPCFISRNLPCGAPPEI